MSEQSNIHLVPITGKINIKDEETFKEVGKIMDWYYNQAKQSVSIDKMLRTQDRLSALAYNLAHIAGDFKDDYNTKYYIEKVEFNIQKQKFIELGDSGTAAEANANVKIQERIKAKREAEAAAYKVDLLLKQVNRVLAAMQQRISHMKNEWERINRGQGGGA